MVNNFPQPGDVWIGDDFWVRSLYNVRLVLVLENLSSRWCKVMYLSTGVVMNTWIFDSDTLLIFRDGKWLNM